MHFRARMTVILHEPLKVSDENRSKQAETLIGYMIVMGVNAKDISVATTLAHEEALNPQDSDGNRRTFNGYVEEAEIKAIDEQDWGEEISKRARNTDKEGVYYRSGLVFFPASEDEETEG